MNSVLLTWIGGSFAYCISIPQRKESLSITARNWLGKCDSSRFNFCMTIIFAWLAWENSQVLSPIFLSWDSCLQSNGIKYQTQGHTHAAKPCSASQWPCAMVADQGYLWAQSEREPPGYFGSGPCSHASVSITLGYSSLVQGSLTLPAFLVFIIIIHYNVHLHPI